MILDGLLMFSGGTSAPGNSDGKTDSPTTGTQASSNVLDLGVGTTTNPSLPSFANGGGARDIGIGDKPAMKVLVEVTVAFVGGTSLQLTLQGAPDDGSGGVGSYTTMWTSAAIVEASMVAGAYLANISMPRPVPGQVLPRFLRLQYITVGTHTAGTVASTLVIDRFDQVTGTAGNLSGYPAGLTVAN